MPKVVFYARKSTKNRPKSSLLAYKKPIISKKCQFFCPQFKKLNYLCTRFDAQMAESVDALVSNTNGVTPVPVRPRLWVRV